jgi:dTMP kinase
MTKAPFIVLDGPDGGGKSTQAQRLMTHYGSPGNASPIHLREPGSTHLSEMIRDILLNPKTQMAMMTEALFYTAARTQLIAEQIRPALETGRPVICERYYWSTVVYQGIAGSLGKSDTETLQSIAVADCRPNLTVILDIPADEGLMRVPGRQDRIESRSLSYHKQVRQGFLQLAEENPDSSVVIDARQSIDEVWEEIRSALERAGL